MPKVIFLTPLIFALVSILAACASITTGTTQNIAVDTEPSDAECKLTNDDGNWFVNRTPANVNVHRSYSALNVTCSKGKMRGTQTVQSSTKGAAYGNILFGGIIGGAVDMSNGAAYDYPATVYVRLK